MDVKKEQQREELHRAIWAIADDLRGSVDGWDFKSYVLGAMFYRYISENLTEYLNRNEWETGDPDFDYAKLSDEDAETARAGIVVEKGFFLLPSELFENVVRRAADDPNLNETLGRIFRHIESSVRLSPEEADSAGDTPANEAARESAIRGLFNDFDVNSNKLGATVPKRNEKLVQLLRGVADMNLGRYEDHSIDAFGDAYEYLMAMYASHAGKSGANFSPRRKCRSSSCASPPRAGTK